MRWAMVIAGVVALGGCSSFSTYDTHENQSASSLEGSQGGGGVQAPLWSNDPEKKTVTNHNPSSQDLKNQ